MNLHITHGRVIDPASGVDACLDLFISKGKVLAAGQAPDGFRADRVIEARGKLVLPGLVDLCARLPDVQGQRPESLASEVRAALAGGVTSLVLHPEAGATTGDIADFDAPEWIRNRQQYIDALAQVRAYPLGPMTQGLRGAVVSQMGALADAGCVGFSQGDRTIVDTAIVLQSMEYAKTFDYSLWLRAQDPWLSRDGVVASGAYGARLGLVGVPVEAETIALHALLTLQRATGVRLHLCRLSSAEGIGLVRAAKKQGLPVTCDVAASQVHLVDVDIGYYDTNFRLDPPLRSQRDRDAIRQGLADGTIDAICSDHTMVASHNKLLPFAQVQPGASGLELLLSLTLKWAQEARVPFVEAFARVTSGPARIFASMSPTDSQIGQLGIGAPADLCIVDPEAYRFVECDAFVSQSKHSPFNGMELPGVVHTTIARGQVVWERPS